MYMQQQTTYSKARKTFFDLVPEDGMLVNGTQAELIKFRDSIYKLSKRYKTYGKMYKTKLLSPTKLQIWRIR